MLGQPPVGAMLAGLADYSTTSGRLPTAIYSAAACLLWPEEKKPR
jgi:hypothetical protein